MVRMAGKTTNVHAGISIIVTVVGLALMIFKIYEDSEPGLIPLLLVLGGVAWYLITRLRNPAQQK